MTIYDRINSGEFNTKLKLSVNADLPGRRIERAAYNLDVARLNAMFRDAVSEDIGLKKDHPKYDKIWEMAWDRGHANGLVEVYNEMIELYELIE